MFIRRIESIDDIKKTDHDNSDGIMHLNALIEPKIDSGNPLHNMFPYLDLSGDAFEKQFITEEVNDEKR